MTESRDLERRLAALPADAWDAPAPPPALDLAGALAARARVRRRVRRPLLTPRRPALAAALVAGGFAAGLVVRGGADGPGPVAPAARAPTAQALSGRAVGLAALGPAPAGAHATARVARDRVSLVVTGLPASRPGQFYEVWAMGGATRLVSLGTFRVGADGRAAMTMPLTVDPRRFPVLDVSREPADGDPAHSAVSMLRSRRIRT
jgi:hypothetical protein